MKSIEDDIQALVQKWGFERVRSAIEAPVSRKRALVVVANRGLHSLPLTEPGSEIFYATEGTLDFSSSLLVSEILDEAISKLKDKIASEEWGNIYLVPFGHSVIAGQIKLAIFRLSGKSSIDYFHAGNGVYYSIDWDLRSRVP